MKGEIGDSRNIIPIEVETAPQWTTTVQVVDRNGQILYFNHVLYFSAEQPGIGRWEFGARNFDIENLRNGFAVTDRGGVIVVAITKCDGCLFWALANNVRPLASTESTIHECPRGFFTEGQRDGLITVRDEFTEEVGVDPASWKTINITEALGIEGGGNCNTTFFDTAQGGGIEVWLVVVPATAVQRKIESTALEFTLAIRQAAEGAPSGAPGEKVLRCLFFPFNKPPVTPDMMTWAARAMVRDWLETDPGII